MSSEVEINATEKWVNLEDIAEHLSVSQDTVRTWIKEGKLPFYRAGNDTNSKSLKWMNGSGTAKLQSKG